MDPTGNESSSPKYDITTHQHSGPDEQPIVPPYWQHRRLISYSSLNTSRPPPITLEDHTEETSEQTGSLWARRVSIEDRVVIQGNVPSLGDYTVWNCNIDTLDVSMRYSVLVLQLRSLEKTVLHLSH